MSPYSWRIFINALCGSDPNRWRLPRSGRRGGPGTFIASYFIMTDLIFICNLKVALRGRPIESGSRLLFYYPEENLVASECTNKRNKQFRK